MPEVKADVKIQPVYPVLDQALRTRINGPEVVGENVRVVKEPSVVLCVILKQNSSLNAGLPALREDGLGRIHDICESVEEVIRAPRRNTVRSPYKLVHAPNNGLLARSSCSGGGDLGAVKEATNHPQGVGECGRGTKENATVVHRLAREKAPDHSHIVEVAHPLPGWEEALIALVLVSETFISSFMEVVKLFDLLFLFLELSVFALLQIILLSDCFCLLC